VYVNRRPPTSTKTEGPIDMMSLQNVLVLCELVMDREARLHGSLHVARERPLRRWLGRRLVAIGAWVAAEPTQPAWAR
jgi:hypothetical protein